MTYERWKEASQLIEEAHSICEIANCYITHNDTQETAANVQKVMNYLLKDIDTVREIINNEITIKE